MLEENKASTAFRVLHSGPRPASRRTNIKLVGGREILHGIESDDSLVLFIPIDATERSALRDNVQGIRLSITDLQGKGVQQFSRYLAIRNVDPRLNGTFEHFVDEVVETLTTDGSNPVNTAVLCLERWRQLLAPMKRNSLSVEAQVGLLHELMVLSKLVDISSPDAVRFWTGPQGARHDFDLPTCSIEVKATLAHDSFRVRVSSIEQMLPAKDVKLYLVAGRFESVASGSLSLPTLIDALLLRAVDSQELLTKLAAVGYHEEHREQYKDSKFNLLKKLTFVIDADFPRLTPDTLPVSQGADRISRLQYDINLSGAEILACYLPNGFAEITGGV